MSNEDIMDSFYKEGALITAKENPTLQLKITKYYQRIYYCAVVGDEQRKQLVYFQHELIPPTGK